MSSSKIDSQADEFQIQVTSWHKENATSGILVRTSLSIFELKSKISEELGYNPTRLLLDDQPLLDHTLIGETGIQAGTSIRAAKTKHKRVNHGPGSSQRRRKRAEEARLRFEELLSQMTPEDRLALQQELRDDSHTGAEENKLQEVTQPKDRLALQQELRDDSHTGAEENKLQGITQPQPLGAPTPDQSEECEYDDAGRIALHLLEHKNSKLEARIADQVSKGKDLYEDGCLLLNRDQCLNRLRIPMPCPLKCGARYGVSKKTPQGYPGHAKHARLNLLILLQECLKVKGGAAAAYCLIYSINGDGQPYEISHFCKAPTDALCIEPTHFVLESEAVNNRRKAHQHGNSVCDCADYGDPPCLENPKIGRKVFNERGDHVGWEAVIQRAS